MGCPVEGVRVMPQPVPQDELEALRARIEQAITITTVERLFAHVAPALLLGGLAVALLASLGSLVYPHLPAAYRPVAAWVLTGAGLAGMASLLAGIVGIRLSQKRAILRLQRARRTTLADVPTEQLVAALCLGLEGPSVENVRADLLRQLGAPPSEAGARRSRRRGAEEWATRPVRAGRGMRTPVW